MFCGFSASTSSYKHLDVEHIPGFFSLLTIQSEDSSTQNDQIVYAVPHAHEEVITSTSDHIVEQHAPPKFDSGHMTRSRSRQAPAPRSETPIPKERPSSPYSDISTSSRDSEDVKDEQSKEELNSSVTDSMRGRTRRSRRHSSMTSADPEDSRYVNYGNVTLINLRLVNCLSEMAIPHLLVNILF